MSHRHFLLKKNKKKLSKLSDFKTENRFYEFIKI